MGIDFSQEFVQKARENHPNCTFINADAHDFKLDEEFDYIILSDMINDAEDVQKLFLNLRHVCKPGTRIIINYYSHLWEQLLTLAERLGLKTPALEQNWLTTGDLKNLFYLADFDVIRVWQEILWPIRFPLLSGIANRYLVKLWPFSYFALTNFMTARPMPLKKGESAKNQTVTVVVPARNEAGNIEGIFDRIPEMGEWTEIVFVEGNSRDNTYEVIQTAINTHPERKAKVFRQSGKGKADAVRLGFKKASGDILMILDADMTVAPEDLPKFYDCLTSGKAEFVNGVRLVYPMEKQAMRFVNLMGNKFFSLAFSWLLGQTIKDSLCGTKVLGKSHYEKIAANRRYFGDFDPFGDFDLLFGAAKLSMKIVDLPVRYRNRTYGTTQISRLTHGFLLIRMMLFAMRRIKFV